MAGIVERNQDATCYVGNLDEKVNDGLLWELFLQAGPVVNIHVPKDRLTMAHQGYGFVEFLGEDDADYAIKILNMIKLFGKPLRVNKASVDKKTMDVGANVFIGNLDSEVDEKLLYDTFSAFGVIMQPPKIMRDNETGGSKGFAFVNYASFDASDAAIDAMNGRFLATKAITVSYAYRKDAKGERHGSAQERLAAAENPQMAQMRPHQFFGEANDTETPVAAAPVAAPPAPPSGYHPSQGPPPGPPPSGPPPGFPAGPPGGFPGMPPGGMPPRPPPGFPPQGFPSGPPPNWAPPNGGYFRPPFAPPGGQYPGHGQQQSQQQHQPQPPPPPGQPQQQKQQEQQQPPARPAGQGILPNPPQSQRLSSFPAPPQAPPQQPPSSSSSSSNNGPPEQPQPPPQPQPPSQYPPSQQATTAAPTAPAPAPAVAPEEHVHPSRQINVQPQPPSQPQPPQQPRPPFNPHQQMPPNFAGLPPRGPPPGMPPGQPPFGAPPGFPPQFGARPPFPPPPKPN